MFAGLIFTTLVFSAAINAAPLTVHGNFTLILPDLGQNPPPAPPPLNPPPVPAPSPSPSIPAPQPSLSPEPSPAPAPPPDPDMGTGKTVVYFGQRKAQSSDGLAAVCNDPSVDIVVLAFLHILRSTGNLPATDFWPYCPQKLPGTDLAYCADWGTIIQQCQSRGKKVLLSIGGATMTQNLPDDASAIKLANDVWALFGGGTGLEQYRPFGDTRLDGFDLDIENNDPRGWPKFISEMRAKFRGASKTYYLSGAPQCPRPDYSLGDSVYLLDLLFIQHYNNWCAGNNAVASMRDWSQDMSARNPSAKIFLGVAGSPDSAGSGYVDANQMTSIVSQIKSLPNYGGIMTWDYTSANANQQGGRSFLQAMKAAA